MKPTIFCADSSMASAPSGIQSSYRRSSARRISDEAAGRSDKVQTKAALQIQTAWQRNSIGRTKLINRSSVRIQTAWRASRCREQLGKFHIAAILIQSTSRGHSAVTSYNQVGTATTLQKHWRNLPKHTMGN
jgi:hypothetical protein